MQFQSAGNPVGESHPSSAAGTISHLSWAAAWLVVIVYTCAYGWMIGQYKALPYWDQSNYALKTYNMAARWEGTGGSWRHVLRRLDPALYLRAGPANRPPLMMMAPMLLWGSAATPQEMAWIWLIERMAMLMVGVWVLARVLRDARWVPGALCVILGGYYFLKLNQNLYMMDLAFASMGLLSVALAARAMQRRTASAAAWAAGSVAALFLIKPQALAFSFPFMAVLVVERVVHEIRAQRGKAEAAGMPHRAGQLLGWVIALAGMGAVIVYLLHGSYGAAVREQYAWGQKGYWQYTMTWPIAQPLLAGVLPPWLLAAVLGVGAWKLVVRWGRKTAASVGAVRVPGGGWLLAMLAAGTGLWLVFSFFMTYVADMRVVWSIMPVVVSAAMYGLWRVRWAGIGATAVAAALFVLSVTVSTFGVPQRAWSTPENILGLRVVRQPAVAEVGLMPLMRAVTKALSIKDSGPDAAGNGPRARVMVTACDEFVDYGAMTVALYLENGGHAGPIDLQQAPFGDDGFDLKNIFDDSLGGWFITHAQEAAGSRRTPARGLVNLRAVEALIVDPASPVHALFEPRLTMPVTVPTVGEISVEPAADEQAVRSDGLTLWHLTRQPTKEELALCANYVAGRFIGTPGAARMAAQRKRLSPYRKFSSGVKTVDEAVIAAAADAVVRDVTFAGDLRLRAMTMNWMPDGALRVKMYWQAGDDLDLTNNRFVHLLDGDGKIAGQAYSPQDALHGSVKEGTCWEDEVTFPAVQLRGVTQIGVGIQLPDGRLLSISPRDAVRLDWDNHRLIAALPAH